MASIRPEKRPSESGGRRWRAQVRKGGEYIVRRFDSEREAQEWATSVEAAINEGRQIPRRKPLHTATGVLTLQAIVDKWLELIDFDDAPKTGQIYEDGVKVQRVAGILSGPMGEISPRDIYLKLSKLTNVRTGKPLAPSSVGKYYLSCIKMIDRAFGMEWIKDEWQDNRFRSANKMSIEDGVVKPSNERERWRVEYLTDWEYTGAHPDYQGQVMSGYETDFVKIEAEIDHAYLIPMIDFALLTGMRMGHIWRISWEDFTFVKMEGFEHVRIRRRRKEKNIDKLPTSQQYENPPLERKAAEFVCALRDRTEVCRGPVFVGRPEIDETVGKHFIILCKRLGFYESGLTFHVLRHEATSRFFEQGYQKDLIKKFTGHRDDRSLDRYTHLAIDEELKRELEMGL